jgi:hypothetical protein
MQGLVSMASGCFQLVSGLRNKGFGSRRRQWHERKHVPLPPDLLWNTVPEQSPYARKLGTNRAEAIVHVTHFAIDFDSELPDRLFTPTYRE